MSKKIRAALLASVFLIGNISTYAEEVHTETLKVKQNIQEAKSTSNISLATDLFSTDLFESNIYSTEDSPIAIGSDVPLPIENIDDAPTDNSVKKEVLLKLNVAKAWIDGMEYPLNAPPKVVAGRTYLPLRFTVDEVVNGTVVWNKTTNTASITKDDKMVDIQIGKKEVLVNGEKFEIESPAILENGYAYLPVRVIADLFNIQTQYDVNEKTITLTKVQTEEGAPSVPGNKAPIAEFSFSQEDYIAGQTVVSIDQSYDEDGDTIIERQWMINRDSKKTASNLESIFKTPKAGFYTISLKVKDAKGVWSEWTDKEILVLPNEKPVVTSLTTDKNSYAGGEELKFSYTYENEEWEAIKSERWTYRHISEPESKAVIDKPKYIFDEGQYIVSLQLEDAYGNLGDKQEVVVNITGESVMTELEYKFANAAIGDIIDNFKGFNYQSYKEIFPTDTIIGDGTLIMSDSPEMVTSKGILYRETAEGAGRILLHHINNFTEEENMLESKRVVLIAENTTEEPVTFVIKNKTIKGPSSDVLYVGQQVLQGYFQGGARDEYSLKPGEKIFLYDSGNKKWNKNDCISGKMDFYTTGKVTFTVAAVGKDSTIEDITVMPFLGQDIHPRGTFYSTDIYHTIVLDGSEPSKLIIGKGTEEWIAGKDGITGEDTLNRGNFGLTYHIKVTAKEDTGILLNPRGGIFRGAIRWDENKTYATPSKGYFSGNSTKAVMLGTIKAGETRVFEYVLPNGSAAPVLIGFVPKSAWNK